jgi:hypothetical protein
MGEAGPQGLEVASLGRRVCAGLVDAAVFGPPILVVCMGGGWAYVHHRRQRGADVEELGSLVTSTRWKVAMWLASGAVRLPLRNWRSPGSRAFGLRRVDVRSGGPLSARNVLVEQLVVVASGEIRRRLTTPRMTRRKQRLEALQPELAEIARMHADDHKALERALKGFYKRNRVNTASSCGPPLLGAALMQAPVLWSPLNQTIPERLAGIVVVQD